MKKQSVIFLTLITALIHFNSSMISAERNRKNRRGVDNLAPKVEPVVEPVVDASVSDSSILRLDKMKPGKDWFLRLTLGGGYGQVNNSSSSVDFLEAGNKYHRNLMGALSTEFQWGRYLGLEAEGYYGLGSSPSIAEVNPSTGLVTRKDRRITSYGVLADVQVRYPLTRFKRDWGFHAGLGYGMMGVKRTNPVREAATVDSSNFKVPGAFATLGVEFRLIKQIAMGANFALALTASPSLNNTTGTTDAAAATFNSGSFSRIRVNAAYIWDARYRFGVEYSRRAISASPNAATVTQRDVMNQFYVNITTIL